MFNRLLGFRSIQRKIEEKIIQLSFIPGKYFEALYVECSTKIHCHTLDILEVEEKNVRSELLALMKEGQVDTKIEIQKFQLFERINGVSTKSKEIRILMNEYVEKMAEADYGRLVKLLKKSSEAGKLMHNSVKSLYDNYDEAIQTVEKLIKCCEEIINDLFEFRFCNEEGQCEYSFEDPEVLIGASIRSSLQDMINVGEKIINMIKIFSYNHHQLKAKGETDKVQK
ncbi:MAG TPA: hypothetical protein VMX55_09735 [candidate division Zixibacteria bacterium]|nr:hypothetical protein [candidate division Zixibacteria bacterium]